MNVLGMRACERVHDKLSCIDYTFTKLTLQAATAITSYDDIVTQCFIVVCHIRVNVYKFRVHVYTITRQAHPY